MLQGCGNTDTISLKIKKLKHRWINISCHMAHNVSECREFRATQAGQMEKGRNGKGNGYTYWAQKKHLD